MTLRLTQCHQNWLTMMAGSANFEDIGTSCLLCSIIPECFFNQAVKVALICQVPNGLIHPQQGLSLLSLLRSLYRGVSPLRLTERMHQAAAPNLSYTLCLRGVPDARHSRGILFIQISHLCFIEIFFR